MRRGGFVVGMAVLLAGVALGAAPAAAGTVELGPRPYFLVDRLPDGPLKSKLQSCADGPFAPTAFSIGHRGAPLMFPEETAEGDLAAVRMGAGIVECDVTFTKDKVLVCRHAQNDLARTTNILATPLAAKCAKPFAPADSIHRARAECRTSDLTAAEFKSLKGKMDAADPKAKTVDEYMNATAPFRTDLYAADGGTVLTHAEYIALLAPLGVKFTPELKAPVVAMPYEGMTQEAYAQKMIDEYRAAGVPPENVFPQSFNLDDIRYWITHDPEFGAHAVFLDGRDRGGLNPMNPSTWFPTMAELKQMGVNFIGPPLWMLVTAKDGKIVPSRYAEEANKVGLKIVTWSLERSGPLAGGGDWYYRSIRDVVHSDAAIYQLLDVLARQVGVAGVFSDWPATVTYYANCFGLK